MEGWFDPEEYVCHGCSAAAGREVVHTLAPTTAREFSARPLSDFDWKTTTTPPTPDDDDD